MKIKIGDKLKFSEFALKQFAQSYGPFQVEFYKERMYEITQVEKNKFGDGYFAKVIKKHIEDQIPLNYETYIPQLEYYNLVESKQHHHPLTNIFK